MGTKIKKNGLWYGAFLRLKRNKRAIIGIVVLLVVIVLCLLAPVIAPEGYDAQDISIARQTPSAEHWFGTDNVGRDILHRILYGGRISLAMGFVATMLSAVVGSLLGAVSGYYSGKIDSLLMRAMDIFQAIPSILLAIAIASSLGSGIGNTMLAVGLSGIPMYARLMRGSVLSVREMEYVESAVAVTASDFRVITKYIIPNVLSPIIVQMTMGYAGAIMTAASLSFIGLGAQAPSPEWGAMITAATSEVTHFPHMVFFPGLAIMLVVVSLNLLGDGVRDALDPKMKL